MARQTAAQKAAAQEEAKLAQQEREAQEAMEKAEQEQAAAEAANEAEVAQPEGEGMNILEAFERARRGAKVRRKGWSRALDGHCVIFRRGESLPVLSAGKFGSPYTPSIVDVMTSDWEEI